MDRSFFSTDTQWSLTDLQADAEETVYIYEIYVID